MAAQLDNVGFTPTAGGTTDWTYSSTISGYQSPVAANAVTTLTYECFAKDTSGNWEISRGACTITGGIPTFARTTVLYNSAGTGTMTPGQSGAGTKINFASAPSVFAVLIKESHIAVDEANSFTAAQQAQARANIDIDYVNFPGFISGLALSTAGGTGTFAVAPGVAVDIAGGGLIKLTSGTFTKTNAAWAVGTGNGSFDGTGAAPTATSFAWYHVFLIKRTDTGVVDVLTSLSATAPTLPSPYTLFRRLGAMKTDGSFHWTLFSQNGNEFLWAAPILELSAVTVGTTASTQTLNVPTGVKVNAILNGYVTAAAVGQLYLSSLDQTDVGPPFSTGQIPSAGGFGTVYANIRTSTSAQIRARASIASTTINLGSSGWIDNL